MLWRQRLIGEWKRHDQPVRKCDWDDPAKLRFRSPHNPKVESSHIVAGTGEPTTAAL
jgi:hypothetical protein